TVSEHKNDLSDFMDNIEDIMNYHKKTADETVGITALQNIKDIVKANPKTDKYYREIQRTVQPLEQEASYDQLQQELKSYSNINRLQEIKKKINKNYKTR